MKRELLKVALRKNAIIVPEQLERTAGNYLLAETSSVLLANCTKLGYTFSEELLVAMNTASPTLKLEVLELLKEITGVNKNWTPLVKQWNVPTGESVADHIITWLANIFSIKKGTKLPCGHLIPDNTFPLDRYNGCPFCGSQFEFAELNYVSGQNKLKVLQLWSENDLKKYLEELLQSPVALDATQIDDLKILIASYGVSKEVTITMKETMMILIDTLVEAEDFDSAGLLFKTPNDVLRYLWYKHTGFLQLVEPKTIIRRMTINARNYHPQLDASSTTRIESANDLKLKFSRTECKRYAKWLNELSMDVAAQCENMHPKRSMWVRVIRALRLAEYSKKKGFEPLAELLDTFYNTKYEVWQGRVNDYKLKVNAEETFALLKQRPGLFARSLFSSMLWFGPEEALKHFREVMHHVPARLIFTLNMYAEVYFEKNASRTVKPLGGTHKSIPVNKYLKLYSNEELLRMQSLIQELSLDIIKSNLRATKNENKTMYIDEELFKMPIAIGDRTDNIQDVPNAVAGTRFKVEGDTVRLFLQWGEGLPAQHLDMDLSCKVAYSDKTEICSYSQLVIPGCKHSGDIQHIPHKVGTAEYIDLDLNTLRKRKAKYVSFTCNAYTNGSLAPNLVVGWMNSQFPMKISSSGVAYDPTAVQHQVRITRSLTKAMVFGVLDVEMGEVIWLEMKFGGQVVQNLSVATVEALLRKLEAKLKIGDLLKLKAEVQGMDVISDRENAEEVYDLPWAMNTAQVSRLFLN